jgi:hypothetical protein
MRVIQDENTMREEIITVQELFQYELDAINNYIVLLENKHLLNGFDKKELKKLKTVARYLVERIKGDVYIATKDLTIH